MSLLKSLKLVMSRPHPAGYPFILGGLAGGVIGKMTPWRFSQRLGCACLGFAAFSAYFFRNPKRVPPQSDKLIVAAADGRITGITQVPPPVALEMGSAPVWRVSIFLSVLDVHLNRMPVSGEVTRIVYHHGQFLNASMDKASEKNERNELCIAMKDGRQVAVVQIAGLIARRIVCKVNKGDTLKTGDLFGLIRFGSRTDIYLPPGVVPCVLEGQTMIGGETVIAQL